MSETDEGGTRSKGGASGSSKTLSLKRTETSTVRQSFSHGRSKAVVVEKKRVRVAPGKALEPEKPIRHPPVEDHAPTVEARDSEARRSASARGGVMLREPTEDEKEARPRPLTGAKNAEEEAAKDPQGEGRRRAPEEN